MTVVIDTLDTAWQGASQSELTGFAVACILTCCATCTINICELLILFNFTRSKFRSKNGFI